MKRNKLFRQLNKIKPNEWNTTVKISNSDFKIILYLTLNFITKKDIKIYKYKLIETEKIIKENNKRLTLKSKTLSNSNVEQRDLKIRQNKPIKYTSMTQVRSRLIS